MELIFQEDYMNRVCRIYLREDRGGKIALIGYDGEKLIEQERKRFSVPSDKEGIKPLLTIPMDMKEELVSLFVTEGARMNMRTTHEDHLEGKLKATEKHLADSMLNFSKVVDALIKKIK